MCNNRLGRLSAHLSVDLHGLFFEFLDDRLFLWLGINRVLREPLQILVEQVDRLPCLRLFLEAISLEKLCLLFFLVVLALSEVTLGEIIFSWFVVLTEHIATSASFLLKRIFVLRVVLLRHCTLSRWLLIFKLDCLQFFGFLFFLFLLFLLFLLV